MGKKIIVLIIILLILGGGLFYWWRWQADVRVLNKGLPGGVRVAKSFGGQYKVNNKKDGYVVKVPESLQKIQEVEYKELGGDQLAILENEIGIEGENGLLAISYIKPKEAYVSLGSFVEDWSKVYMPTGKQNKEKIGNFDIIQVRGEERYGDLKFYFLETDSKVYKVSLLSEEFVKEIILKSEW